MNLHQSWVRKRIAVLFSLGLGIIGLCVYSGTAHPWFTTTDCAKNPDKFDGRRIEHFSEPKVGEIHGDGFILIQKGKPSIRVLADTTGLVSNHFIGLSAVYHKEGYLEAVTLVMASKRRYKMWLSVIPVIIVGVLLLRNICWNRKEFQLELKDHA